MLINKDMSIGDIVNQWPETAGVFRQHGMGCLGCAIAHFETLAEGVAAHEIDLEAILGDLNKVAAQS